MPEFISSAGIAKVFLDDASGTPVDVSAYVTAVPIDATLQTADSTMVSDTATKFVFTIEDGGEIAVTFGNDTSNTMWTLLSGLWNGRKKSTLTVGSRGNTSGLPKMAREIGITKLGLPIEGQGALATIPATLKADGATTVGTF